MRKIIIAVFCSILFLSQAVLANIYASEKITSFTANIQVKEDGRIQIEESINYDFGGEMRHGIYWKIPLSKVNNNKKKYRLEIKKIIVTDNLGKSYPFSQSYQGDNLQLKIGNANSYVSGEKLYKINYEIAGAITYFSDHDELNWNIIGNGWEVPIASANATINFPQTINQDRKSTRLNSSH